MDFMRSCYTVNMQFDETGDIVVPVTWYFCDPDAKVFPVQGHKFGSQIWIEQRQPVIGIGERWDSPLTYANGSAPFPAPGNGGYCGPASWFTDGCPSDAPPITYSSLGVPTCCPQPNCAPWTGSATPPSVVSSTGYTEPFHLFLYNPTSAAVFLSADNNTPCAIGPGTDSCGTAKSITGSININNTDFILFQLQSYDPTTHLATFIAAPGYVAPAGFSITFLIPP